MGSFARKKLCSLQKIQDRAFYLIELAPGVDPEKNLTRAQPKVCECGYMGVALSMGSYRHELVDAAQLSA